MLNCAEIIVSFHDPAVAVVMLLLLLLLFLLALLSTPFWDLSKQKQHKLRPFRPMLS